MAHSMKKDIKTSPNILVLIVSIKCLQLPEKEILRLDNTAKPGIDYENCIRIRTFVCKWMKKRNIGPIITKI